MRKKLFLLLILAFVMLACTACGENAQMPQAPGTTQIFDEAKLFNNFGKEQILEAMKPLALYGNVGVVTLESGGGTTASKAADFYDRHYGTQNGFLFVIDMKEREIYIETDGYLGSYITRGKARLITDNVYKLASKSDYTGCVIEALKQANDVMEGREISHRMSIISNIIIALMLGTLANFLLLRRINRKVEVSALEWETSNHGRVSFTNMHTEKKSKLIMAGGIHGDGSSRGSHHHRSGGFGGGFGGGHHSHGGGHRF